MAPLSWEEMQANAIKFSSAWKDAKKEEAEAQPFTLDFIKIFGIVDPLSVGEFEVKVPLDEGHTGYIDYFWPKKIAMEMKSPGKDLKKAYEQLKEYVVHLPPEQMPDILLVSDFANFHLYHRTSGKKTAFKLKDLRRHLREFSQLAGYEVSRAPEEQLEVNVQAAEKMATLHDALLEYGYAGHPLEIYLVRLLFCLFADDTGIFPKGAFLDYVENSQQDGSDLAGRLAKLFEVLDMPPEERKKHRLLTPTLLQFQYINGKLFSEILPQADFDSKMRQLLIQCGEFDWSRISPAIFGSIFQGVMDRKKRRTLGAHYTSEENILKLINPLFMDDLWAEFEKIKASPARLDEFHNKIATLKFLDPACGCGNFLIITYRELRRLELAILKMKIETAQKHLDLGLLLKVRVNQFFGIEREEFPAQIAQVGMWLMDHQMNMEAAETFGSYYIRLPLKQSAVIEHKNSLKTDWLEVVPGEELSYILGNPPFVGARMMTRDQKEEARTIFSECKLAGELDYVTCWFKKADEIMRKFPRVKTAFVATNSITQGVQPGLLWKPILENGSTINFAYKTFKWRNDARGNAAVHCVIIGFNHQKNTNKFIFENEEKIKAKNINGYLVDAKNIYVESRKKPISKVPEIGIGCQPIDGGNYLFSEDEKEEFIKKEPQSKQYFHKFLGSDEFINNRNRYCLWLGNCPPNELKKMPLCLERIEQVRRFREDSTRKATKKLALTPTRFQVENMPGTNYLVIPKVSSERRFYLPIGFEDPETICSDLLFLMPNATLYHFGVLSSSVHNAWIRAIAGRLEMRYRYSKDIVYNNFPWPERDEKKEQRIMRLARDILDTRAKFAGSSLADLYGPLTMPPALLKAHQKLDKEVLKLYGISPAASEEEIVMKLFERYTALTGAQGK
ncbi:MAG: class I SAM-dependent DNA methyltransferase [Desulfovibrio sp.]|nr:class I SAM-dependent DNA methyltransferase [Desulfovibrio sp.]